MYSSFALANKYIRYYAAASNSKGHGMHSPFVFRFILAVLNNGNDYMPPAEIETLRKKLLTDTTLLQIEDMGAGSRTTATKSRTVKQLAASALKPKKYAQLLFRLAAHYAPQTVVELGTSLGISTAYLASANPEATIYTIEGSEAVAAVAAQNFAQLSIKNIRSLTGNFDKQLPLLLQQLPVVDLAYIDGNHRYAPTIAYFTQLLHHANYNTILVFDDIHWSAEMEQAWEEIKAHPQVRYTIDIFFLGFVFFNPAMKVKQHFSIRF